jgi:hypothetical protein
MQTKNAMSQVGKTIVPSSDFLVDGNLSDKLRLPTFKPSTRYRPRLHPQAQGTGVLRAINQLVTDRAYIPRHKAQGFYARSIKGESTSWQKSKLLPSITSFVPKPT